MDCVKASLGARVGERPFSDKLEGQAINKVLLDGLQRWCLDVSDWDELSPRQWGVLLDLLPEDERSRVNKFMRENDRRLALGSRLLQRAVVSKVFGLKFADVVIRRTSERKPFFPGVVEAIRDGAISPLLINWNFNVSHHGKFVAIASEPVCLCGVDIVDTNRRSNDHCLAEDYFRYFTQHFTDSEWDAIKRAAHSACFVHTIIAPYPTSIAMASRPVEDKDKLRRFYLNWGLKEAYVKAIGQGLGYDLQRVSFVDGAWLDCCSWTNDGNDNNEPRRLPCHDPGSEPVPHPSCGYRGSKVGALNTPQKSELWGREDNAGCTSGLGTVTVKIDGIPRPDWSFHVFGLHDRYAACVARGPPSECSPAGQAAGVISNPDVEENTFLQGQSLPQLTFRSVNLEDIIPDEVARKLKST